MRTNMKPSTIYTHEGAKAKRINPNLQLMRSVNSCLLFEREFYEDGESIAYRIEACVKAVEPKIAAQIAIHARTNLNLRHAPLFIAVCMAKYFKGKIVSETIAEVIQRADELPEFLALYWRDGKCPISAQAKKGLAKAFKKFDEYQLAKYNRKDAIKLIDVMRLVRPKPSTLEQEALWGRLKTDTLVTPDTWETNLSAGEDKRYYWTRALRATLSGEKGRLGYLAVLRNLRNMLEAGVDMMLIAEVIEARRGAERVLPFRYIAAARAVPQLDRFLNRALLASVKDAPCLAGKTIVLVDLSDSMNEKLSSKSDLTRLDAAAALASLIKSDFTRVFSFSAGGARYYHELSRIKSVLVECPAREGLAGIDAIKTSQKHGGTLLGRAVAEANQFEHDRLIVITDEQSQDTVPDPVVRQAYMINVASARNGVGYGRWTHIDGFSESVIKFLEVVELD